MWGPHPKSHETLRYFGHVTNKKRYISTFTRPMDPKLSKVLTQMRGPHLQSHVTHRPCGHARNQNRYIFTFTRPMDPKLSRLVTQDKGTHPQTHMTLQYRGHVTNKKSYISTFTRPMNRKLSRLVIQDEGASPTNSRDTSTTWSHDKSNTLYLHFNKYMYPRPSRVVFRIREIHPQSYVTLQLCRHVTTQKYLVFTFKGSRSTNFAGW